MVILVIGAHPDDIELGVGASIYRFRREHQFHGFILTSGGLRASPDEREQANIQSAEILGYTPHFGRLQDGAFTEKEADMLIEWKIAELNPDLVIGHSPREQHRDHQAAYMATLSSSGPALMLMAFEGPHTFSFSPQLYVPVDDADVRAKNRAVRKHALVLGQRPYLEEAYVKEQAKNRGAAIATMYAEAFMVDRLIYGPFTPTSP